MEFSGEKFRMDRQVGVAAVREKKGKFMKMMKRMLPPCQRYACLLSFVARSAFRAKSF